MESDDDEPVGCDRSFLRRRYYNIRGWRDHDIRGRWHYNIRWRRDCYRQLRGRLERIAGLHRRQYGQ